MKKRPSRLNHLMKVMFGWFYWIALSGLLDPMLDIFFMLTKPRLRPTMEVSKVRQV